MTLFVNVCACARVRMQVSDSFGLAVVAACKHTLFVFFFVVLTCKLQDVLGIMELKDS